MVLPCSKTLFSLIKSKTYMDLRPTSQPALSLGFSTEMSFSSLSCQNHLKNAVHMSNVQGEGQADPRPAEKQQSVFNSASQKSRCAWSRVRKKVSRHDDPEDNTDCSATYQETSQSGASVTVYMRRPGSGLKKSLAVTKLLCIESKVKQSASTMAAVLMETNAENLSLYKAKVNGNNEGITDGSLKKRFDKDKNRRLTQSALFTRSSFLNQPEYKACGQQSLNSDLCSELHGPLSKSKHYFESGKHQNAKKLLAIKTLRFDNGYPCSLIPGNFSRRSVTQGSTSYSKKMMQAMNIRFRPSASQNDGSTIGDIFNALASIAIKDRQIKRHTAVENDNDTLAMETKIANETRSVLVCRSKAPNPDFIVNTSSWPVKTLPILEKLEELETPTALEKERNTTSKITKTYTDNEEKSINTGDLLSVAKRIRRRVKKANSKNAHTRNKIIISEALDKSLPRYNCKIPNDKIFCPRHETNTQGMMLENRTKANVNVDKHVDGVSSIKSEEIINTNKHGNKNANEKCIKGKTMEPVEDCLEKEAVYEANDNLASCTQTKTVNMIPGFNGGSQKLNDLAQSNDNMSVGGVNTSSNLNLDTVSEVCESHPTIKETITLGNSQKRHRAIISGKAQNKSINERAEVSNEHKTTVCTTVSVSDISSTKSECSNTKDKKLKPKTMTLPEHKNASGFCASHFAEQKALQPITSYKVHEGAGTHEDRDVIIHQRDINTRFIHDIPRFRKNKKSTQYKRKARTSKTSYFRKKFEEPSNYIERKSSNALTSVSNGPTNFHKDGEVQSKSSSVIFLTKGSEESKSGKNHTARFKRVKHTEKNMSNIHNKTAQYEMVKNCTKSMRMRTRRKAADGVEPAYIDEKNNKPATKDVHDACIYHADAPNCPRGEDFEKMTEHEWIVRKVKDEDMIDGVSMYERRLVTNVTPPQRALARSQSPFKVERPAQSGKVLRGLSRTNFFPKRSMSQDYRPRDERIQLACRKTAPCRIIDINLQAAASAVQARLEDMKVIPRRRKGRVALPIMLPGHFNSQNCSSSADCETSAPFTVFVLPGN